MKKFVAILLVALLAVPTFLFASAQTETIGVDGDLNDTGWKEDGWTTVTAADGAWQGDPTTDETISYRFQVRKDDTKVYFAFKYDEEFVPVEPSEEPSANGVATNIRVWIHNGDETKHTYTHFYDVFMDSNNKTYTGSYFNTNPDGNAKAAIEEPTMNAVSKLVDGKWQAEFSIDLAEFGGETRFEYYFAVSSKITENVCLFYPAIPLGEEVRLEKFPYKSWYKENAGVVDDSLKLGAESKPVDPEEPEEPEEPSAPTSTTLVSQGVNYTVSGAGHGYTDLEGQWPSKYDANLTDGLAAEELSFGVDSAWFGLYYTDRDPSNPNITSPDRVGTITLDLGEVKENLCKFRAHLGNHHDNGVPSPEYVKVSTSVDGTTFTEPVAFTGIRNSEEADNAVCVYWVELTTAPTDGQFVRFEFKHPEGPGVFIFLDELEAYTGTFEDKPVDPEEPEEPEDTYEDDVKAAMGEKNADGKFDVVLTAPETYKAGDTVTVKATVNNVTYEKGLYLIEFHLVFDDAKLENTNVHNADNSLEIITKAPGNNAWENLTKANFTDGTIEVSVTNPNDISDEAGVKEDGSIEFTFTFKAKEDADGQIGVYVPHDSVHANDVDFNDILGNGTYVIIDEAAEEPVEPSEEPSEDTSSEETSTPATSDNGINVIVFAIIALVAVAGTAIVIKSRN